jgi:hypothetical protein
MVLPRVVLPRVVLPRVALPRVALPRVALPRVALPRGEVPAASGSVVGMAAEAPATVDGRIGSGAPKPLPRAPSPAPWRVCRWVVNWSGMAIAVRRSVAALRRSGEGAAVLRRIARAGSVASSDPVDARPGSADSRGE